MLQESGLDFTPTGKQGQTNVNIEDADAVIVIKSNKKIDSVEIRFQEDK